MEKQAKTEYIGFKLPENLKTAINAMVDLNKYANVSHFIRSAIREKISRETCEPISN